MRDSCLPRAEKQIPRSARNDTVTGVRNDTVTGVRNDTVTGAWNDTVPKRFSTTCEARTTASWCGRRDLNPHGPCGPTDFRTHLRLSPPLPSCQGLGSGLSLHHVPDTFPVYRCCPSSLYTFPTGALIAPAGLGLGSPCYRVPRIWAVLHRRFPGEHSSLRLSPMRLPIPPRPHGFKGSTKERLTRSDF